MDNPFSFGLRIKFGDFRRKRAKRAYARSLGIEKALRLYFIKGVPLFNHRRYLKLKRGAETYG